MNGTLTLFLALCNEMALKSAIIVPKNTMPRKLCIALTNKSDAQRNKFLIRTRYQSDKLTLPRLNEKYGYNST